MICSLKTCKMCGAEFSSYHGRIFCSRKCSTRYVVEERRKGEPFIIDENTFGKLLTSKGRINGNLTYLWKAPNHSWCKSPREVIFCIDNSISSNPICPVCNVGELSFGTKSYYETCSTRCANIKKAKKKWGHINHSDYSIYKKLVMKYTYSNNLKSLPNNERVGRIGNKGSPFHLDHKFSVREGFIRGILPHHIGGYNNLEFLPALENIKKQDTCSISESELFDKCKERK